MTPEDHIFMVVVVSTFMCWLKVRHGPLENHDRWGIALCQRVPQHKEVAARSRGPFGKPSVTMVAKFLTSLS